MSRYRCYPLSILAIVLATLATYPGLGHTAFASACPPRTVCDRALGLALTPYATWQRLAPPQVPQHVIILATRTASDVDYDVRLHISAWGTTMNRNDVEAARIGANRLIHGFRTAPHVSRILVHYGGAPGVLIRSLPPTPGPTVDIVLAHAGAVYLIIAPGSALAADQRAALASLRFISRNGPFPSANPPTPSSPHAVRTVLGGAFYRDTLTLNPANGIHRGTHTYSLWLTARKGWLIAYSVPCSGTQARLVIQILDLHGSVLDRVLHRSGAVGDVRQVENVSGTLRLDVQSPCPNWSVTASVVYG